MLNCLAQENIFSYTVDSPVKRGSVQTTAQPHMTNKQSSKQTGREITWTMKANIQHRHLFNGLFNLTTRKLLSAWKGTCGCWVYLEVINKSEVIIWLLPHWFLMEDPSLHLTYLNAGTILTKSIQGQFKWDFHKFCTKWYRYGYTIWASRRPYIRNVSTLFQIPYDTISSLNWNQRFFLLTRC